MKHHCSYHSARRRVSPKLFLASKIHACPDLVTICPKQGQHDSDRWYAQLAQLEMS